MTRSTRPSPRFSYCKRQKLGVEALERLLCPYNVHCTCCESPATNTVYHRCKCSLELLCSRSHAGMDTFMLQSISCNKMLPPHKSRMNVIKHHCTMLARKFLLLVLCLTTQQERYLSIVPWQQCTITFAALIPKSPDSLQLSYHKQKCKFVIYMILPSNRTSNFIDLFGSVS